MTSNVFRPRFWFLSLMLFPAVAVFLMVTILPMIFALVTSFTEWSGGMNMKFIGLENYVKLFKDMDFWLSLKNNILLIVLTMVFQITLAFLISLALSSKQVRFKEIHRNAIFIPVVISPIIIGILWWMIYDLHSGLLNTVLKALHLEMLIKQWLGDPAVVLYSVATAVIWQYVGLYIVVFLASLQSIPEDVYESAEIDGATGFKKTVHITIPLLTEAFKIVLVLAISGGMKIFDHIYVMTGGGPAKSSMVVAQYAYETSFKFFNLGYGSALSIAILVIGFLLILASQKLIHSGKER